jgi:hypothetical protein
MKDKISIALVAVVIYSLSHNVVFTALITYWVLHLQT